VAAALRIQHAPDGLVAAGKAVGAPGFESGKALICADQACALMDMLDDLPVGAQDHWLLLHDLLQLRVTHLPRGSVWEQVSTAVGKAEARAAFNARKFMGCARVEAPVFAQMTLGLPLCHGGLEL
jgi:hypothetical protein